MVKCLLPVRIFFFTYIVNIRENYQRIQKGVDMQFVEFTNTISDRRHTYYVFNQSLNSKQLK